MEYRKEVVSETVRQTVKLVFVGVGAIIGALGVLFWQTWFPFELEYTRFSKNGYLTAGLGQQGLTMAHEGKPLQNVSIVEFLITNQASRQFTDVDLLFSVDDPKSPITLVSSGIIPPSRLPHAETVEELPVKDVRAKKFRLKVIPKQQKSEYFDAIFVFDGEKAPAMAVESYSTGVSIGAYQEWKLTAKVIAFFVPIYTLAFVVPILLERRVHQRRLGRFRQHATELREKGELQSTDEHVIEDAVTIYNSFTHPKPLKFWGKRFGIARSDD